MPTPIEDFNSVFHERLNDIRYVKDDRRVITMHIGGVVIECLVKAIVLKYYGITQKNSIQHWIATKNASGFRGGIVNNPSHKIMRGIMLISALHNRVDLNLSNMFQIIQRPLNVDFIDLRYYAGNVTDSQYDEWERSYKIVKKWLLKNLRTM